MNVYTIISMTYIQLIQPLSKQSGVAESIGIITQIKFTDHIMSHVSLVFIKLLSVLVSVLRVTLNNASDQWAISDP